MSSYTVTLMTRKETTPFTSAPFRNAIEPVKTQEIPANTSLALRLENGHVIGHVINYAGQLLVVPCRTKDGYVYVSEHITYNPVVLDDESAHVHQNGNVTQFFEVASVG